MLRCTDTETSNEELHDSALAVKHSQSLLAVWILRTLADIAKQLAVVSIFSISEHLLPAGSLADDVRSRDFPYLNRFFSQQLRKVLSSFGVPQAYILYIAVFYDVTLRTYVQTVRSNLLILLRKEAAGFAETLVLVYQTSRSHVRENGSILSHLH